MLRMRGWIWLTVSLWASLPVGALDITDDRGTVARFATPPQRIVSLLPSLTETVCAMGECGRLVGVDRHSNYPDSVAALPHVEDGQDPNIEAIVALRPDVVLMMNQPRTAQRLRSLGLQVMAFDIASHADVQRMLDTIGQVLAVPSAQKLWHPIETALQAARQTLPASSRSTRVYFEVHSAPFAAGESSFIGQTLQGLGVQNIVPASLGPFPKINPEFVVRADPDVIIVGDHNFAGMDSRPGWRTLHALRSGRVCILTPAQIDVVVRPGPRMAEGAHILARCLRDKMP